MCRRRAFTGVTAVTRDRRILLGETNRWVGVSFPVPNVGTNRETEAYPSRREKPPSGARSLPCLRLVSGPSSERWLSPPSERLAQSAPNPVSPIGQPAPIPVATASSPARSRPTRDMATNGATRGEDPSPMPPRPLSPAPIAMPGHARRSNALAMRVFFRIRP